MATKPKSQLVETYKGFEIRYRPWLKRRPYRCQLPGSEGRKPWADVPSLEKAREIIDAQLIRRELSGRNST